jgi:hypothetical protein
MIVTGSMTAGLSWDEQITDDLDSGDLTLSEAVLINFLAGTAAGQCDRKWSWTNTLSHGASDTWTLSALTDGLGRNGSMARVKGILVETSASVDGDDLGLGAAATHPWTALTGSSTAVIPVKSLGVFLIAATNTTGLVVTSGSSDQLKITNNSSVNPITYRIALAGCSV